MKKAYGKPHVYVERFELCEHISRTCDILAGAPGYALHWEPETCAFNALGPGDESMIVFLDTANGCMEEYIEDMKDPTNAGFGAYNGMPFTPSNVFSS